MSSNRARRGDYTDSQLMDALDKADFNIAAAARELGLHTTTLRSWILHSDNLSKYIRHKQAEGALKAREKLEYMLDNLDPLDPRSASILKDICKTLMDKYEPDLSKIDQKNEIMVDNELQDKIKKLLGDD